MVFNTTANKCTTCHADEYLARCAAPPTRVGRARVPQSWQADSHMRWFKQPQASQRGVEPSAAIPAANTEGLEECMAVDQSVLLMKFYKLTEYAAAQLMQGRQVELQMALHDEQMRVVTHPGSMIIIGRSGALSASSAIAQGK